MPELPEVETVARQLAPLLRRKKVKSLKIMDLRLRDRPTPPLRGRRVIEVDRAGKQVRIAFGPRRAGDAPLWLLVHLRMTGRLVFVPEGRRAARTHVRARFALDRGALVFDDVRRFGTFRWCRSEDETVPPGVDPTTPAFTPARLAALLGDSRSELKPWLLRQDRLVGLGNIYASEILHAARLSPRRPAGSLDRHETGRLHRATRRILERAIANCGTTFSDFQDARGVEGSYQELLAVYGGDGESCPRCGGTIERIVQQQRSTFYCPRCQR